VEDVLFSRRYIQIYGIALKHVLIFERLAVRVRRFGAALGSVSRYADLNDIVGDVAKCLRPRKFPDKVLPCHAGERLFDIGRTNS
jgi:hypothetical protein